MLRTRPYGRAPAPSIGRCIYCGRAEGLLTREHVIPKSLGGHFQAPQDPNWFYSFLSQSAAAVIGVLGAVLVSRLLQALLEARASAARVIDSFVATRNALVARTNEIEGYAAFLADKLPPLQALLDRGESTFDTTHWQEFGTSTSGGSFRKELSRELLVQMRADEQACGLILSTLPLYHADKHRQCRSPYRHEHTGSRSLLGSRSSGSLSGLTGNGMTDRAVAHLGRTPCDESRRATCSL